MSEEAEEAEVPSTSPDPVEGNIEKLKAIFPEAVTEDGIDAEVLLQLLGEEVAEGDEKYGLSWHGKKKARQLALTPSAGTLRPAPEDSVDWDTTQNLMIEGDNLEVLKLLQKSYAGKVKLIYIDPPYNTGKDFVYPDNFTDSIGNYLALTGQVDEEGNKISSNTESSGRFHTDWLNMMYPRLKLARELLRDDGLLLCSISDTEQSRARQLGDEVFGEKNFVAQLIWLKGKEGGNDNDGFGVHHDYVLCYVRNADHLSRATALDEKDTSRHRTELSEPNRVVVGDSVYRDGEPFQLINLSKQKDYEVVIPLNDGTELTWPSYAPQSTVDEYIRIGKIFVGEKGVPYVKSFLADEAPGQKPSTVIESGFGTTKAGGIAIRELLGNGKLFSYPKPPSLIERVVQIATPARAEDLAPSGVILDFFAGSGTTGHAVMAQNAEDGGNRRYILVQLPEPLDPGNKDQKVAAEYCDELEKPRNIAELTKERLRRAAEKVKEDNPDFEGDLGFRVFKLDSSNIRAWDPQPEDLDQQLEDSVVTLKEDRGEEDVLYEVLLKLGLDLCVPIETREIAEAEVHSIGAGTLFACLAGDLDPEAIEELGQGIISWRDEIDPAGETTCLFRDSAFPGDVSKMNLNAILEQGGIETVRSI